MFGRTTMYPAAASMCGVKSAATGHAHVGPPWISSTVGSGLRRAPGGISTNFLAKVPGATLELGPARMEFRYDDSFCAANQLEAYERLIHDALLGDRTLFTRADGIERLWEVATPLLERPPAIDRYPPRSWGPDSMNQLIAPRRWHLPEDRR